jgi:3',5'-cyclic AMP phosphodiesterase CpdA
VKFVVLSDLHLGPPGVAVNGLDPAARLTAAVAAINRDHANADFVAIAGDLADLGEVAAYEVLRDRLAQCACRVT